MDHFGSYNDQSLGYCHSRAALKPDHAAYDPRNCDAVITFIKDTDANVNLMSPSGDLSIFLCACLSGNGKLIKFLLQHHEADVSVTSAQGDSPLYLATYALLCSVTKNFQVLQDLLDAGCDINHQNKKGFTCLHRAASKGNIQLVEWLLDKGAKPDVVNSCGVYPIGSAINAGHLETAKLLEVDIANPHCWDIVDPHTPNRIQLGLQSPQRKFLSESTIRRPSYDILKFNKTV